MSRHTLDDVARLQETIADGRLANPVYRREQLVKLFTALTEKRESIQEAIVKDSTVTQTEAFAELYQTFSALKSHIDATSPTAQLAVEYSVSEGKDAVTARNGLGIVVLEPQFHTLFFSIFSPLGAAIAAGNPVVLVLKKTLHHLPAVVHTILEEALDPGLVAIIPSEPTDLNAALYIRQGPNSKSTDGPPGPSPSNALTVAIVDRTANAEDAARAAWAARSSFGGTSPYAPDVIFVNEFSKKEFLACLLHHCLKNHDSYPTTSRGASVELPKEGCKSIASGAWGQVMELTSRSALSRIQKPGQRTFYIYPYRSLEDVIELANDLTTDALLATYAFGDKKTCKYLLQFVDSEAGFANVAPTELLVGPAAPRGHPTLLDTRYSVEMFSRSRPRYAEKTRLSSVLDHLLCGGVTAADEKEMLDRLLPEKRKPANPGIGYFERGALVGALTIFLPVLGGISTAAFVAGRIMYRKYLS